MWDLFARIRSKGVLAINKRNADYTLRFNPRRLYPCVDDKLRTKTLALENGIAVPDLYAVVRSEGEVRQLPKLLDKYTDWVVKPAHGSGGAGILIISDVMKNGMYRKQDGYVIDSDEFSHHVYNILSGLYSLGGQPDQAIIEYRVNFDPVFEHVIYQGVPDIRIIVFLGVPVMSMIRLPTRESKGKANLHQGAIGVGINMATGETLSGVLGNRITDLHPDTGQSIEGISIPGWDALLGLASRSYELTGLGYQGVDIVLDRNRGPLLLELNARPGLNIQLANKAGLLPRLEFVQQERASLVSIADRVAFSKTHFNAAVRLVG
jgi:alpha-L-glutamate ligase-like protein